jgi:hypothetical protein
VTNISIDTAGNEFFAYRTEYSFDEERDEYVRERKAITEWSSERIKVGTTIGYKTLCAFDLIIIDAQRDIASDIRDRTSVWSKQISKIRLSREAKTDIEEQLSSLSTRIIKESPFLQEVAKDLASASNKVVHSISLTLVMLMICIKGWIYLLLKRMQTLFQMQNSD